MPTGSLGNSHMGQFHMAFGFFTVATIRHARTHGIFSLAMARPTPMTAKRRGAATNA